MGCGTCGPKKTKKPSKAKSAPKKAKKTAKAKK